MRIITLMIPCYGFFFSFKHHNHACNTKKKGREGESTEHTRTTELMIAYNVAKQEHETP